MNRINDEMVKEMNFSYEEIFSMFGQFDTFVTLEFHFNSKARQAYGERLLGNFLYNLEERESLQRLLNNENIPRTNEHIRFSASSLSKLSKEQTESLDRIGIRNSDIARVSSMNLPRENRFTKKGKKKS